MSGEDDTFEDIDYVLMFEQAKLSQDLFDALYLEHQSPVLMLCTGKNLDSVFASTRSRFEQSEINMQDPSVALSHNNIQDALKRLHSTRERLDCSRVADCFQNDGYLGSDYREAIMSPDDPECAEPKRLFYTATYLLRFLRPIVSDAEWSSTHEMCDLYMATNKAGDLAYVDDPDETRLTTLIDLQDIAAGFPDLARILESRGHKNLAFLADAYGRKAKAVKSHLVCKAETQLLQAKNSAQNILNNLRP